MSLRVRLALCVLFTVSLIGAFAFRLIRGERREIDLVVALKDPLVKVDELTAGATIVRINGVEVRRSTSYTDRSVNVVLDRVESECPSGLDDAIRDMPGFVEATRGPSSKDAAHGVAYRWDGDGSGAVLCLVGDDALPRPAAPSVEYGRRERVGVATRNADSQNRATFATMGFGRVRYVRAVKGARTRIVAFWSTEALDFAKIFPAAGEAPGNDSAIAARPVAARRTLSLSTENLPTAMRVYESSAGIPEIVSAYDAEMRTRGYKTIVTPWARLYRGEGDVEIVMMLSRDGDTTRVTLLEIAPRRMLSPKQWTTS